MPDIGLGEIIVIVVIALLVFGPDRLPKVAADAARMLRQVRQMAASARKDLVDAAGLEDDAEMAQAVRDLRDLDPRRAMQGVLSDDPARRSAPASADVEPGAPRAAPAGPTSGPAPGPRRSAAASRSWRRQGSGPGPDRLPGRCPAGGPARRGPRPGRSRLDLITAPVARTASRGYAGAGRVRVLPTVP